MTLPMPSISTCIFYTAINFENMGVANKKRIVTNDVSKHCQLVVDDFFAFSDGRADEVQYSQVDDIKEPMPPTVEQLKKMFARCKRVWADYCDFTLLPRECRQLFVSKVKAEWQRREKIQKAMEKRKRHHSASS